MVLNALTKSIAKKLGADSFTQDSGDDTMRKLDSNVRFLSLFDIYGN